jgi:hypothetical protein
LNNGASWTAIPKVSSTAALLLSSSDEIRFVPSTAIGGKATLAALGWDGSVGTHGTTVNPATVGSTAFSTATASATCLVNAAPALSSTSLTLSNISANATSPSNEISTLLTKSGYSDSDGKNLLQGIAIVGVSGSVGIWQYMLKGGLWTALPGVSTSAALLLPGTASLRFISNSSLGGSTLSFLGWDETEGVAGGAFDISSAGGATAFSVSTATLSQSVRQTTSWSSSAGAALSTLLSGTYSPTNASSPAGSAIASVFGSYFQNNNSSVSVGLAVTGATGNGTWQYSLNNGASWTAIPRVSSTAALLLSSSDEIRFVPSTAIGGKATLAALGWDGSVGTHGTTVNPATIGSTAFSATTTTATCLVNAAPALSASSVTLASINENVTGATMTVSSLLSKSGYGDPDGKMVPSGIAIAGFTGLGNWQWLNGKTWTGFPSVSSSSALLLTSTADVRFVPVNNLPNNTNGTASLTYRAWDQTQGSAGTTYTISNVEGTTAFSANTSTATMNVSFVKRAPVWVTGAGVTLPPVLGYSPSNPNPDPAGNTVAGLFGSASSDAPGISVGIAIAAMTGTAGTWQYSTNGGTNWVNFPTLSTKVALLLSANAWIRFVPNGAFSGAATLTAYAWDGSTGSEGGTANLSVKSATGGTTAFSATTITATCLVNSAPVLTS